MESERLLGQSTRTYAVFIAHAVITDPKSDFTYNLAAMDRTTRQHAPGAQQRTLLVLPAKIIC